MLFVEIGVDGLGYWLVLSDVVVFVSCGGCCVGCGRGWCVGCSDWWFCV